MSIQYDQYLREHKENVKKGFEWLVANLPTFVTLERTHTSKLGTLEWQIDFNHDASKSDPDEYSAYDAYFYGGNRSYAVVQNFNRAWLRHLHNNPHHWQHWVLINDDPANGEIVLEMPQEYLIEMICDWWSFSWKLNKLDEIFAWYEERRDYIKLGPSTRTMVEDILEKMKDILNGQKTA